MLSSEILNTCSSRQPCSNSCINAHNLVALSFAQYPHVEPGSRICIPIRSDSQRGSVEPWVSSAEVSYAHRAHSRSGICCNVSVPFTAGFWVTLPGDSATVALCFFRGLSLPWCIGCQTCYIYIAVWFCTLDVHDAPVVKRLFRGDGSL